MKIDKYSITATELLVYIHLCELWETWTLYQETTLSTRANNNKIADIFHLSLLRVTKYFYQNLQQMIFMVC